MERVTVSVIVRRRKGCSQEVGLRYGEDGFACVLVNRIVGSGGRNDQIIGIITTGKEDADQCFVIVRIIWVDPALGGGRHETQVANGGGHGGGADGGAGSLANEGAAI